MDILYKIGAVLVALIVVVFSSKKWGQQSEKTKQAKDAADTMEKYEKIDNNPDVDSPMSNIRMRNK